jgi:hypothetical protein
MLGLLVFAERDSSHESLDEIHFAEGNCHRVQYHWHTVQIDIKHIFPFLKTLAEVGNRLEAALKIF